MPGQRDRSRARASLGRTIRATGPEQGRADRCERAADRARRSRGVVELRGGGTEDKKPNTERERERDNGRVACL